MRRLISQLLICCTVVLSACEADSPAPVLQNPVPIIRYLSISPKIVTEFTDSIIVEFEYKDGDGDLGHKDPDFAFLSVQDARLKHPDFYYVPPLAPIGSNVPIEGKLSIKVRNTFLLGAGGDELTSYEIRMRDRVGNWSNYINTETITIKR